MNKEFLLSHLEKIKENVVDREGILALLVFGSCAGDGELVDEYSDLDFLIITEKEYKNRYIENLDWLESISGITFLFKNAEDAYKLLQENGVFSEFGIVTFSEFQNIPLGKGRVVWKSDKLPEDLCLSGQKPERCDDVQWLLNEILTDLYIGLCRYRRGEKLSACALIQNNAVAGVTRLAELQTKELLDADEFDSFRRFEKLHSDKKELLPAFIQGYNGILQSAEFILKYLTENYEVNRSMEYKIKKLIQK